MISAILNSDMRLLFSSLGIYILYIVSFLIFPELSKKEGDNQILRAAIMSHFPMLVIPLVVFGLNTRPYRGIFENPNSLGSVSATVFTLFFSLLLGEIENIIVTRSSRGSLLSMMVNIIMCSIFVFLVFSSGSRTSFLTVIIIFLIGLVLFTLSLFRKKSVRFAARRLPALAMLFIAVLVPLYKRTEASKYLYMNIISKFYTKALSGNLLSGRGIVWYQTMKDAGLFGRGNNYFDEFHLITPHNTFISILGRFGWVPLLVFLMFLGVTSYYASRYAIYSSMNRYKYIPVLTCLCFVVLSMGEVVLFQLSMLLAFFFNGRLGSCRIREAVPGKAAIKVGGI